MMKRAHGELEKPMAMTQSGTYLDLPNGQAPTAKGSLNTNGGRAPGTPRISKHPVKSLTSRKSQQMNGNC